jgi:hypothetical protein
MQNNSYLLGISEYGYVGVGISWPRMGKAWEPGIFERCITIRVVAMSTVLGFIREGGRSSVPGMYV